MIGSIPAETARYRFRRMSRATLWILGGIFAIVLAICVAGAVLALSAANEDIDVNLGTDEFEIPQVDSRAELVADEGALRFADPTGGSRPIIVNHVGEDAETGWVAVLAIAPGTDSCIVDWDNDDGLFRDCEGGPTRPTARASTSSPPGRGRHPLHRPRPRPRRRAGPRRHHRRQHRHHRRRLTVRIVQRGSVIVLGCWRWQRA